MSTLQAVPPDLDLAHQFQPPPRLGEIVTTPRVLIVEDDLDVHEGWSLFLRHHGYETLSAYDGVQGLEMVDAERPDLLLLDLGLPGVHGLDLLARLRERHPTMPVVVITASSSAQTDSQACALGADVVLAKPISPHKLVPLIEELLRPR